MPHVVADLPSTKASQAAYSTYYLALVDDYDAVKASMTAFETGESNAMKDLVPRSIATKLFAVDSGNWNTAANWYPSGVPATDDYVVIGEGCTCTYNKSSTTINLKWLRVDGTLTIDTTMSTALRFDTMVVMPLATLRVGTRSHPLPAGTTCEFIVDTSRGAVDVLGTSYLAPNGDPYFQSRGIFSMGVVDMWGATKTPFTRATSQAAPASSATSVVVDDVTGWAVGDEIAIAGQRYQTHSYTANLYRPLPQQTEKRTITGISGNTVSWTGGLTYSHAGPSSTMGMDTRCYIANLTRNIVIRSDVTAPPLHHRGHTMQMHNYLGWNSRYVEFRNQGRTVKHGGLRNWIYMEYAAYTANTSLDLTNSPWWNVTASAIVLGPATTGPNFLVRLWNIPATAGGGTCTITGTKQDADQTISAQTETIAYTAAATEIIVGQKYFSTVTDIKFDTNFAAGGPYINIEARARQRNTSGTRDMYDPVYANHVYTTIRNRDNIQSRYPFHWHKIGVLGDVLETPPVLDGCVVNESPGWGYAHHQSHGHIKNCVSYDCVGAGFVAEDGNETGVWKDSIAILGSSFLGGFGNKDSEDEYRLDPARCGMGFAYTGRMIRSLGLIACDMLIGHGYNTRFSPLVGTAFNGFSNPLIPIAQIDQPKVSRGQTTIQVEALPIAAFEDCKAVACSGGIGVIRQGMPLGYDLHTKLLRFESWSCLYAMDITYTVRYASIDCRVLYGFLDGYNVGAGAVGIGFNVKNNTDQSVINPVIEGYETGINLNHSTTATDWESTGVSFEYNSLNGRAVVNPTFYSCAANYGDYDASIDVIKTTAELGSTFTLGAITQNTTNLQLDDVGTYVYHLRATKTDEIGNVEWPHGSDYFSVTVTGGGNLMTGEGYWTDYDGTKYTKSHEFYSSRLTGEPKKKLFWVDLTEFDTGNPGYIAGNVTNRGSFDSRLTTPPTFSDFAVSMTRNTNLIIDIAGRASGNTPRFGGFTRPMKTYLKDNEDGTITAVPLADENYTESCYVWVDDVNGNTTRATMTINVNKMALYLGRADLLAA